jgi:Flp pilus assembly protein TadD
MTVDQLFEQACLHHLAGRLAEAEAAYRQILLHRPNHADALHLLGALASQVGKHQVAIELIERAIAIIPPSPLFQCSLGNALQAGGQLGRAIEAYRQFLAFSPNDPQGWSNLADALHEVGRIDEAAQAYQRSLELGENLAFVHSNLANFQMEIGRVDQAISSFRRAIALEPRLIAAHYNLAQALLLKGDFQAGWAEYESRRAAPQQLGIFCQSFALPSWDGAPLNGRRILIHAEQGFGDTIQFIRYLPLVADYGGKVILQVQPQLHRLLTDLPVADQVLAVGEPLPEFDLHCPLMSLPFVLGARLETMPNAIPYLRADSRLSSRWHKRLPAGTSLKVGLVWSGRKSHFRKHKKQSLPLDLLIRLKECTNAKFFSLQLGAPMPDLDMVDWTSELVDFSDTAGLIHNLDLVITVDTAVAHLAGAMGKNVWVLLAFIPDWRWMLDREDSPWYPTMRLFRQPAIGDWQTPISRVVEELRCLK